MNLLRVWHRLTAHHLRDAWSGGPSVIAICECGWKHRGMRPGFKVRLRMLVCAVRGHRWEEEPFEAHVGPVDFEESDDTLVGRFRQCEFCYRCIDEGRDPSRKS